MSQSDFVTRGQALVNSGQFQEAVKVCRLGLLGRPTTVEGRVVLGQALLALKRFDEVLAEMRVALELDHTSITAQMLKGEALLRKGDPQAASEVLQAVRLRAGDPRIDELLAECHDGGRPGSRSQPSVKAPGKLDDHTRNYPNRSFDGADDDDDGEPTSGAFGEPPTSVSTPGSKKRSAARGAARPEPTPSPKMLAVGDKSGTVEVDPELEGIELDEDDFGEAVSPPSRSQPQPSIENQRGAVLSSGRKAQLPLPNRPSRKNPVDISSVELEDDDVVELDSKETLLPEYRDGPGPVTRARNAVGMASGPLEAHTAPAAAARRTEIGSPAAARPTMHEPAMQPPPHLAQMIASAPHEMVVQRAQMSSTMRGNPSGPPVPPIASALPTMAAQLPPNAAMAMTSLGIGTVPNPAAARPTLAVSPAPDPNAMPGSPGWARATIAAGHPPMPALQPPPGGLGMGRSEEPTSRPMQIDPGISSISEGASNPQMMVESSVAAMLEPSHSSARVLKTGMRKGRSKLQIAIWLLIGAAVIAGGVFVGFKFRAMRLDKKISDTRNIALGLARADTWKGLVRSRDRLAGIAQASPTVENRAALARTRAQIAFEFGDNVPDAQKAVDGLGSEAGFDVEIAAAYLALAQDNSKNALAAAGRADQLSPDDPAALYVTGRAELAAGDATAAVKHLEKAVEKEGRPLYRVALALALAETSDTAGALAVLDSAKLKPWFDAIDPDTAKELAGSGIEVDKLAANHPAITITRVQIMTTSGQLGPKGKELRQPLADVINEGGKGLNDQPRGVSPAQVAFGHLALSALDFELGLSTSKAEMEAALKVGADSQSFAERAMETLYLTSDFAGAKDAAGLVLHDWPDSRRAKLTLARIAIAQGKPNEALDAMGKLDVDNLPGALVLRGQARIAMADLVGAKSDFDNALKKAGDTFEAALVGRAWVDLGNGNVDDARKRMQKKSKSPSPAVVAVWANILRRGGVANEREEARTMLEAAIGAPPSVELLPVQLELARFYREVGDIRAKDLYAKVVEITGNPDARLEFATYLIEFQDPPGGRESLDQLLKVAGDKPSAELLLEAARAHMLVGDHKGAADLLDQADKNQNVTRWKYDRERGRLALRKAALNEAALSLDKALDNCGEDLETFLLAAEVASADDRHGKLGEKVKGLLSRLKDAPEAKIVSGKLLGSNTAEAGKLFEAAGTALDKASPRRKAQAQLGRAIVAYYGKDDPAAIDLFELAITLDPSLYEAYIYLADIHIQNMDKDAKKGPELAKKALERSKKAADYNPDNVDAYVHLGIAAHKLGDKATLKDAITRLGALAPNSEQLKTLQQLR